MGIRVTDIRIGGVNSQADFEDERIRRSGLVAVYRIFNILGL